MKSQFWLGAAALRFYCFSGIAQARENILTVSENKSTFTGWTIYIDYLVLLKAEEFTEKMTGVKSPMVFIALWMDVQNTSDHAETFIPRDDVQIIAGGISFVDLQPYWVSRENKGIEPAMTGARVVQFKVPKVLLKDAFMIRVKGYDIKVRVSQLGSALPSGVSYPGCQED